MLCVMALLLPLLPQSLTLLDPTPPSWLDAGQDGPSGIRNEANETHPIWDSVWFTECQAGMFTAQIRHFTVSYGMFTAQIQHQKGAPKWLLNGPTLPQGDPMLNELA